MSRDRDVIRETIATPPQSSADIDHAVIGLADLADRAFENVERAQPLGSHGCQHDVAGGDMQPHRLSGGTMQYAAPGFCTVPARMVVI